MSGVRLMNPIKAWLWKLRFNSNIIYWREEETWSGTFESKCSVMSDPCSRVQIDLKRGCTVCFSRLWLKRPLWVSKEHGSFNTCSESFGLDRVWFSDTCSEALMHPMNAKWRILMQWHYFDLPVFLDSWTMPAFLSVCLGFLYQCFKILHSLWIEKKQDADKHQHVTRTQ